MTDNGQQPPDAPLPEVPAAAPQLAHADVCAYIRRQKFKGEWLAKVVNKALEEMVAAGEIVTRQEYSRTRVPVPVMEQITTAIFSAHFAVLLMMTGADRLPGRLIGFASYDERLRARDIYAGSYLTYRLAYTPNHITQQLLLLSGLIMNKIL